jgi:ElaB/YqjD/DUF883 family membrane-anchored ribosome-binding protein
MDQDTHRNVAQPTSAEQSTEGDATGPHVEELRSDMAQTRQQIGETLQAIEERLAPSNLASNAVTAVRASASRRMEQVMSTASERMTDMAERTRDAAGSIAERAGTTPWPAILIGAGLGYLLYRQYGGDEWRGYRTWNATGYGRDYPEGRSVEFVEHPERYESSRGDWSGYSAGERQDSMVDRGRQQIARAGRQASTFASRGARMVVDNPIGFGIAAFAVGAAVGLSAPETETENEWMGEARDALVDRAKEMAGAQTEPSSPTPPAGSGGATA